MIRAQSTILLVDSSRFYLTIEAQFLRGTGANILEVQSVEAALAACHDTLPGLIYLDAQIEDGKGLALCRQIKTTPSLSSLPVILLYDQENPSLQQSCVDAGCDGYLSKPLNRQRFLELGRSLLAGIREKRSSCELSVDYRTGIGNHSAKALDISSGGVFLQTPERFPLGETFKLEIHLGSEKQQGPRICCDGSIAWENRPEEPVKPHLPEGYGVKFTVVPPQAAAILNGFLKTLKMS